MGKLVLIGLGLYDEKDLTLRGLEIAKQCDVLYAETYTSGWRGSFSDLEDLVGKLVILLQRSDMEENSEKIVKEAAKCTVGIFIPGDPLVATTHSSLIVEARKNGITVEIVHSSSIYSAIAESGLHIYKFGATVSLPASGPTDSMKKLIAVNQKEGFHTLVLCDIGLKFSKARDALVKIFDGKVVAISELGAQPQIVYTEMEKVPDLEEPFVFVIPGKLHFSEEEYLESCSRHS
jgi:diphthine synthase